MMAEDSGFQYSFLEGQNKFQSARSRAFLQEVLGFLRGKSPELLSFDEIKTRLRLREESYKGLQDIPVAQIAGSVGRYKDFTRDFLPKSNNMRERWSRVYASVNSLKGVPPIDVFKVGDLYFVRDGNHRVSVAKQIGAKTIEAHVTELPTSIDLQPGMTLEDLNAKTAYVVFLEETELKQTRPHHQSIELSEPSRYPELMGHIYLHAQVMEQIGGQPVSMRDAAVDWYDKVYRPAVTLIRKHDVLDRTHESQRTEADMYLWMVDHLRDIQKAFGTENRTRKFSHALVDYLAEKKIPIPRELLDEKDDTVILSRSQAMRVVQEHRQQNQNSEE